jgi:hypothetical protein
MEVGTSHETHVGAVELEIQLALIGCHNTLQFLMAQRIHVAFKYGQEFGRYSTEVSLKKE